MSHEINTQILERIAEDVNEMSSMAVVKELGLTPIADSFDEFLAFADMDRLRDNLHIALCFSPMNEKFPIRAQKFPAIFSATSINWMLLWL